MFRSTVYKLPPLNSSLIYVHKIVQKNKKFPYSSDFSMKEHFRFVFLLRIVNETKIEKERYYILKIKFSDKINTCYPNQDLH